MSIFLVRLLLARELGHDHVADDCAENQDAPPPLHLVERVSGVAEYRIDGGEDLACGGDGGAEEGAELGEGVVDEALAEG